MRRSLRSFENRRDESLSHRVIGVGHVLYEVLPWLVPIVVACSNVVPDRRFVGSTGFLHYLILTELRMSPANTS